MDQRNYRNQVLRRLLDELDLHDPGQASHADRVAVYAVAVADRLGQPDEFLETLRCAALLHDVGKVKIDQALLQKLGKLTDQEFDDMKLHAELAVRVVASYDWLAPALPMIGHHHEWWDGSGYPSGLAGEAIPLGARIIGIAEAFDAMTFGSWTTSREEDEALEEIRRGLGTQFDPGIGEAFFAVQRLIQPLSGDWRTATSNRT